MSELINWHRAIFNTIKMDWKRTVSNSDLTFNEGFANHADTDH